MQSQLRTTLPVLLSLLLGYGLLQMGNTLQGTLLSVRGGIESYSAFEIGLVGTGFWMGLVLGSLYAGTLIRRVGHTRVFAALASLASAAPLLHVLYVNPVLWVLERALTGFCFAGLFMVVESWLNSASSSQIRGQVLSIYGMVGLIAGISGQMLLPTYDPSRFQLFCVVSVVISLALVPVALSRASAPSTATGEAHIDVFRLYRQSPFGVVAAFLCGICTASFFTMGPLLAQQIGLNETNTALFMAIGTLGGFVMTWPFGWISDRIDRRGLIVGVATVATVILTVFVTMLPDGLPTWVIFGIVAIFGAVIIPTYGIVIAHVNDFVPSGEFVSASGGLLIVQGIGAATGPLVAGAAMSWAGPAGLAYTTIAAQVLMAVWGMYRMTMRSAPTAEAKEPFVAIPTAPVGTSLTPAHEAA
ncbi:MFS transporter [Microvirga massiliensis]|uniref:MFS transporter n=1 Tax=Microvirga massiliensis TaxID=1033741 RepID=UPI00062B3CC9|nr:MFS transporter [Microvirga massiliensis]